jgi:hypothetical protein
MNEQILDEVVARRFWLGQLSPEEQGRIEELAFDDPQWFAFLQAAEDDLIDEFVYDDLSSEERTLFEKNFLEKQPKELREDVEVARAMRAYFEKVPAVQPTFWERFRKWFKVAPPLVPIMIKAILIIGAAVVGLVTLIPRIMSPGFNPAYQVQQQQPPALPSPTSAPIETPAQPSPSPVHKDTPPVRPHRPMYALLVPGVVPRGGGGAKSVAIRPGRPTHLRLLLFTNTRRNYQAKLELPLNGQPIQTWSKLTPRKSKNGNVILVRVSRDLLKSNQTYRIVLNGVAANGNVERVDNYQFKTK